MSRRSFTRREVLALGGAAAAGVCLAGPVEAVPQDSRGRLKAYRLSSRGRRASPAVKAHNANTRFKTKRAADRHRLHPGDRSRIVPLDISVETLHLWFPNGEHFVDLRALRRRA